MSSNNVIKIISGNRGKFPIKLGFANDKLAVTIYLHQENSVAGKINCWSYLTEGLAAFKQKECLLTIRINDDENIQKFPSQPLQFFTLLLQLILKQASQNKTFDIGDTLALGNKNTGKKGLFGFSGVGFVQPLNSPKIQLRRPTLSCILLTDSELLVAQKHGLSRIIARMGYEQDSFPCLPWLVRDRKSLLLNDVMQSSLLNNTAKMPAKHTAVYMEDGETVVLNIPKRMRSFMLKAAEGVKNNQFALLTQILPGHDGFITWLPHKDSSEIISEINSTGEFIGGCFIMFRINQETDNASMIEDGFEISLTSNTWHALKIAMVGGESIFMPGTKGAMNFQLVCSNNKSDMEKPFPRTQLATDDSDNEPGLFSRLSSRLFRR